MPRILAHTGDVNILALVAILIALAGVIGVLLYLTYRLINWKTPSSKALEDAEFERHDLQHGIDKNHADIEDIRDRIDDIEGRLS